MMFGLSTSSFVITLTLELAAILGAGDNQRDVEGEQPLVRKEMRHVAVDNLLRQALDDGRLADTPSRSWGPTDAPTGCGRRNGILFNHESPYRAPNYVTRKIARAAARIAAGVADHVTLGNLEARRDWGFAGDYVRAMYLMAQADEPDDYVIATGESHSVREFCELAFGHVGLDYERYVRIDERLLRPIDITETRGDASRARLALGWEPTVSFSELVTMMVAAEVDRVEPSGDAWQIADAD